MAKRQKLVKTDGLGPYEIKRIRSAVRLVWQRSHARALVVKRCTDKDGFQRCEKCKKRTPSLKVDHIQNVGDVDNGFITRMFVPSSKLQGLCKYCHNEKTKFERTYNKIMIADGKELDQIAKKLGLFRRGDRKESDEFFRMRVSDEVALTYMGKQILSGVKILRASQPKGVKSATPKRKRNFTDEF